MNSTCTTTKTAVGITMSRPGNSPTSSAAIGAPKTSKTAAGAADADVAVVPVLVVHAARASARLAVRAVSTEVPTVRRQIGECIKCGHRSPNRTKKLPAHRQTHYHCPPKNQAKTPNRRTAKITPLLRRECVTRDCRRVIYTVSRRLVATGLFATSANFRSTRNRAGMLSALCWQATAFATIGRGSIAKSEFHDQSTMRRKDRRRRHRK
jgi:hypothetical protein